ncbi:uncharacterized protein EI90DRAFT_2613152 [Cantharellus anzutake]|uniref:uncharacterized protein n=1 Tax=Cantharellus anzutake TaxID=1750568 RepID=UPI0019075247|nr:uncharacterized protein EI90DRAFT_2613152 [Cantharellus anzutake]KAF8320183.1 hypothetical protein EI90DRAFT_2613152 [Cantharellus anzutake]
MTRCTPYAFDALCRFHRWTTKPRRIEYGNPSHPFLSNGRTARKNEPPDFSLQLVSSSGLVVCSYHSPFRLKLSAFPSLCAHRSALYSISGPSLQEKQRSCHSCSLNSVIAVRRIYFGRGNLQRDALMASVWTCSHRRLCLLSMPLSVRVELCGPVGSHGVHPTGLAVSITSPLTLRLMLTSLHVQEYLMSPSSGKEEI